MSRSRILFFLLALALLAPPLFAGSVSGKVIYADKVPNLPPIKMDADPACAGKHSSPVYPEILVLGDGGALANVLVQVTGVPEKSYPTPKEALVIDQDGCQYKPHVAGVMVDQQVMFRNSDGVLHNVHGMPKANRDFNIGMPATLKEKSTTFSKPEEVFPIKCDVHPWMSAYIAVFTHPFFAVTGTDGSFTIDGLPAGSYQVVAWHEKLGTQTAQVTVSADGSAAADFTFKVPKKN